LTIPQNGYMLQQPENREVQIMVCLNHPNTDAVTRCSACGKPLCAECVYESNGRNYCSVECAKKAEASEARSGDVMTRTAKANAKAGFRKFVTLVIVLVLAAAAWYFYSKHKKEIDSRVSKGIKTIQKESSQAIQSGHKAIEKDSKYKRDRENLVK